MDDRILTEMPLDELGVLHQSVATILVSRLETEKVSLRIGCANCVQMLRGPSERPARRRNGFAEVS
jgi:hypothetical protein